MWIERDFQAIEKWLAKSGKPPSYLGIKACKTPDAIPRIRKREFTFKTFHKVMKYIAKHPV